MKALIIVSEFYNGHELFVTLHELLEAKYKWTILSSKEIIEDEVTHKLFKIDGTYFDTKVDVKEYDLLFVVSGALKPTKAHWTNPIVQDIVKRFFEADKVIAGICCSSPTVRVAANGKRVARFPLVAADELLKDAGAILTGKSVEVDGKLITAEHQMASQIWADAAIRVTNGEEVVIDYKETFIPTGKGKHKYGVKKE